MPFIRQVKREREREREGEGKKQIYCGDDYTNV